MDQTEFEKRIAAKAEERFNKEAIELARLIHNHPIGKRLQIQIDGKLMQLANFGTNYGLINENVDTNANSKLTNLAAIKEDTLKQYRQEEVDGILAKMDNFSYLFNQQ